MARRKKTPDENSPNIIITRQFPPATTPKMREDQLIALATDRAEQQIRDGTASSQVLVHYLKLGSTREKIEKELMAQKLELDTAKTEAIQSAKRVEELYASAIQAMRSYAGQPEEFDDDGY